MRIELAYKGGYYDRPGYWFRFEYDEEVVQALKAAVPAGQRAWDNLQKLWWVSEEMAERLPALEAFIRLQPRLL